MAYADLAQVLSRAGQFRDAWDDGTRPSLGDIETFLTDAQSVMDMSLGAAGLTVPVEDETAIRGLAPLNADMALQAAFEATPSLLNSEAGRQFKTQLDARITAANAALSDGTLSVIKFLEEESGGIGASDFWTEDALLYEEWSRLPIWELGSPVYYAQDPWGVPIGQGPTFTKGMRF